MKWSKPIWDTLHITSFTYPLRPTETDKENARNLVYSIQATLPCKKCRRHTKQYLDEHPIDNHLGSREDFMRYIWNFHNHVNREKGLEEMSWIDAVAYMTSLVAGPKNKSTNNLDNLDQPTDNSKDELTEQSNMQQQQQTPPSAMSTWKIVLSIILVFVIVLFIVILVIMIIRSSNSYNKYSSFN